MKTVTITLHDTDNCGSSLQAFALQHFLLSCGIENEIVDYVPEYVKNNGTRLKTFIRRLVFYRESKERDSKFRKFVSDNLRLTKKRYHTLAELMTDPPEADCYITGSDQLWNSMYGCGNDPAFYLDFVKKGRKMAYAVSLGREKIPQENIEIVGRYAQDFQWISVRESSSVRQVQEILRGKSVDHVCDPVLLNPSQTYRSIQAPRLYPEPYILVYMAQIPDTAFVEAVVRRVRERMDGKVVLIGSYRSRCDCDIHKRDVAPAEFLSLIANAEYIISNSFHATMFSLIYEKQFATILPESNGARIKEILEFADLGNHAISQDIAALPWIADYTKVREKLNGFRQESQKRLLLEMDRINYA